MMSCIQVIIILIVLDILFSLWRNYRRRRVYNQAKEAAKRQNKQLLVIGSPNSGFWNKKISKAYGCGDICLDLIGCNECPTSIKGDVLLNLKHMPTNSYVIYESCVLEYIDQRLLGEVKQEIERVCGGDYYEVRIKPNIFPTNFSFIEFG